MSFTRTRRRRHKGTQYAGRILLARAAAQQHGEQMAILGTLLTVVSLLCAGVGWYQGHYATSGLDLSHVEDTPEMRASLEQAIATLSQAKVVQNIGDLALVIGGGLTTFALLAHQFRKRWFFHSTLLLSAMLFFVPVVGTVFAAVWFVSLYRARREFLKPVHLAAPY